MITGISEATGTVRNVLASQAGRLLVEIAPKCQDLGCLISGSAGQIGCQVPVSGVVNVPASHTGLGWVRQILYGLQSAGTFDVGFQRIIGSAANYSASISAFTGQPPPSIASRVVTPDDLGGKSIPGDSCRFYAKNVGGTAADIWLYVQLMA